MRTGIHKAAPGALEPPQLGIEKARGRPRMPTVKRKEETKHGHNHTQAAILQVYDASTESMQFGKPYQTLLNRTELASHKFRLLPSEAALMS